MKRRVTQALLFVLITVPLSFTLKTSAASSSIVIESYRVAGPNSTTDEYVELFNPSNVTVNITGWQLAKKTASGSKYSLVSAFPAAQIKPGESLIVGHKESLEPAAVTYSSGYSISEDNTIVLYSDAGKTVVDKVGFGKATDFEGTVAPTAGPDLWSRGRRADTDNNLADFKKITGPAKDYSGLCLSEIQPSPSEGEEWIELYNSEMTKDIGGLIIADKAGSVKQFTVPEGTIITEGQYLVFYKKSTGITLNDDGDGVVLIDGTGQVFDDSGDYGKVTKGSSFAFDGTKWQWTVMPTPGAANKISVQTTATVVSSQTRTALTSSDPVSSTKGTVPGAAVLGATTTANQSDIFGNRQSKVAAKDRLFGLLLLGVALTLGLVYTVYVNREKIVATFNEERKGYSGAWAKIRSRLPWR